MQNSDYYSYVALLRAINVGGNSLIKMTILIESLRKLPIKDTTSYIQTGNIIFKSSQKDPDKLAEKLEHHLFNDLNLSTKVFILTPAELKTASLGNPFHPEKYDGQLICHLMFLSTEPDKENIAKLMSLRGDEYKFAVKGKVFYFCYDKSIAGNRRNINFEKVLGVSGTARTWKVINKLIELSS